MPEQFNWSLSLSPPLPSVPFLHFIEDHSKKHSYGESAFLRSSRSQEGGIFPHSFLYFSALFFALLVVLAVLIKLGGRHIRRHYYRRDGFFLAEAVRREPTWDSKSTGGMVEDEHEALWVTHDSGSERTEMDPNSEQQHFSEEFEPLLLIAQPTPVFGSEEEPGLENEVSFREGDHAQAEESLGTNNCPSVNDCSPISFQRAIGVVPLSSVLDAESNATLSPRFSLFLNASGPGRVSLVSEGGDVGSEGISSLSGSRRSLTRSPRTTPGLSRPPGISLPSVKAWKNLS